MRGELALVWSYIIEFENQANPFDERRLAVCGWKGRALVDIAESPGIVIRAKEFVKEGLRPKDALHLACAVDAKSDVFLTTDDGLLRFGKGREGVRVINPVDFVVEAKT